MGESVLDVTFSRLSGPRKMQGWRVLENTYSDSDHNYVVFKIVDGARAPILANGIWSIRSWIIGRKPGAVEERAGIRADGAIEWLNGYLRDACDSAIPRPRVTRRRLVYWWSPEIAGLCN